MATDPLSVLSDDVETGVPELSDDDLRRLYEAMVVCRALDERCLALQRAQRLDFYVPAVGHEALSVGAAWALQQDDWLFPSTRDLGMYLVRGGSLRGFLDQAFGNTGDPAGGRALPCHPGLPDGGFVPLSGPSARHLVHATGCAMAMRNRHRSDIAVASFGDGATARGEFHTALTFAVEFRAPVLFLCHSTRWSISVPRARSRDAEAIVSLAEGHGVETDRVDGNDVLAVYRVVRDARNAMAGGDGPRFVEAVVHRLAPQAATDDAEGGDLEEWLTRRDPLRRYREYLERRGVWDAAWEEEVTGRARERVAEALDGAEHAPTPDAATALDDVTVRETWMIEEQRERLQRRRESPPPE